MVIFEKMTLRKLDDFSENCLLSILRFWWARCAFLNLHLVNFRKAVRWEKEQKAFIWRHAHQPVSANIVQILLGRAKKLASYRISYKPLQIW